MSEQSTFRLGRHVGIVGVLLLMCLLWAGAGASAARGKVGADDFVVSFLSATPQCTRCAAPRQHNPNYHRCTHGSHARFAANMLRSSPRVVDGKPGVGFARMVSSGVFDRAAQSSRPSARAERFDETFKSVYGKTRRMHA